MRSVNCNQCGTELAEADACVSRIGWLCEPCSIERPASADIGETYRDNALYSLVCAIVSLFINPLAGFTIAAVILGRRALIYPRKLEEHERAYLEDWPWVKWVAWAGILVALGPLAIRVVMTLVG